ncbi:MAG TPA: choice-of-anchor R domain-containing protein [Terriglobales bacterium]|nr:choice-of-anchor R domain-containing protein [Terriglobales bacterium]
MSTAVRNSAFSLAILLVVSGMAMAANKNEIALSKDGRQTTVAKAASPFVPQSLEPPSNVVMIYDNASHYPLGVYWCCNGWTISGSGSQLGFQAADALPFTPSVNATVTRIGVAVSYISGDNEVTVSLNADNSGLPGASLASFTISNLPSLGMCCAVELQIISGISVTAGTQYWIVVQPTTPASTTWAAWNDNDTNQTTQNFAFQNSQDGSGWFSSQGIFGAFAVAGTVP